MRLRSLLPKSISAHTSFCIFYFVAFTLYFGVYYTSFALPLLNSKAFVFFTFFEFGIVLTAVAIDRAVVDAATVVAFLLVALRSV